MSEKWDWRLIGKADAVTTGILNRIRKATNDTFLDWETMNWLADKAPDSLFTEIVEKVVSARQVAACAERNQERIEEQKKVENLEWSERYPSERWRLAFARELPPEDGWRFPTVAELRWKCHTLTPPAFNGWYWSDHQVDDRQAEAVHIPSGSTGIYRKSEALFLRFVREKRKCMTVSASEQVERRLDAAKDK